MNLVVLCKQIPIAVGYYLKAPFGNQYYSYFGEGCVKLPVNGMLILEKIANNYFKTKIPLQTTPQEEVKFQESDGCWLCEEHFSQNIDKFRGHDHPTGHYRGAAHNSCNLNCKQKQSKFVPVYSKTFLGMIVI